MHDSVLSGNVLLFRDIFTYFLSINDFILPFCRIDLLFLLLFNLLRNHK